MENDVEKIRAARKARARGCLLGQIAGDSLGSLVEFKQKDLIAARYPSGLKELRNSSSANGDAWTLLAGQPTDDTEMAFALARTILAKNGYERDAVFAAYRKWIHEDYPFDYGRTTYHAFHYELPPSMDSQANGAMMRVSPLGIYGACLGLEETARLAEIDASLSHPNPVCTSLNGLYASLIADAVFTGEAPQVLFERMLQKAERLENKSDILPVIYKAEQGVPENFMKSMGWVLIAFQNAIWHLLHSSSVEEAVSKTVLSGGDTDTNGAICGALMGAVYGEAGIPEQWKKCILSCRPQKGVEGVAHPRPEMYWPVDCLELADKLFELGETNSKNVG